jgi:hypothetical protein
VEVARPLCTSWEALDGNIILKWMSGKQGGRLTGFMWPVDTAVHLLCCTEAGHLTSWFLIVRCALYNDVSVLHSSEDQCIPTRNAGQKITPTRGGYRGLLTSSTVYLVLKPQTRTSVRISENNIMSESTTNPYVKSSVVFSCLSHRAVTSTDTPQRSKSF